MARKRKTDTAKTTPTVKQTSKSSTRKSSRQLAKKQLEEQRLNGEIATVIGISVEQLNEHRLQARKHKETLEREESKIRETEKIEDQKKEEAAVNPIEYQKEENAIFETVSSENYETVSKDIVNESDNESQTNKTSVVSEEKEENNVDTVEETTETIETQLITTEQNSNDIVWPEEESVIEETIICEEMEVEGDGSGNTYTIAQDGSILLEQVYLMNDENYTDKVVEYTVIQNEDGVESMVTEQIEQSLSPENENSENVECSNNKNYDDIEKHLRAMHMNTDVEVDSKASIGFSEHCNSTAEKNKSLEIDTAISYSSVKVESDNISDCIGVNLKNDLPQTENGEPVPHEIPVKDELKIPATNQNLSEQKSLLSIQDLKLQETSAIIKESDELKNSSIVEELVRTVSEMKSTVNVQEDNKHNVIVKKEEPMGFEDTSKCKMESCSKNSNDTTILNNADKLKDIKYDKKSHKSEKHSKSDKKSKCRNRSGSTDTTGSESGSSSSTIRRSNRAKAPGTPKSSKPRGRTPKSSNDEEKLKNSPAKANEENASTTSNATNISENLPKEHKHRYKSISSSSAQSDKENKKKKSSQDAFALAINASEAVYALHSKKSSEKKPHPREKKNKNEDIKISSSSDNSTDTLLSTFNCKMSDLSIDNKSSPLKPNEFEKKSELGNNSTDTSSESGSNSSGIRRSNRIRTLGLTKPKSRGRGLVTKTVSDSSKPVINPERDKNVSTTPPLVAEKNGTNKFEKDNFVSKFSAEKGNCSASKVQTSLDCLPPPAAVANTISSIAGYDSDSNKPVKVKSRWRRSSELEMSLGTSNIVNAFPSLPVESPSADTSKVVSTNLTFIAPQQNYLDIKKVNETIEVNCDTTVVHPKVLESKSFLSVVPEVPDKEMEERLSQFEHIKENLYLTERVTNKETKRMACDCFMTEEEIERGELGCGEDCLNRLLMIECGSRCIVGDRCTNKRFQNCQYAKCDVFKTDKKGYGLRALADLAPGNFIMEYVGEVVDPKDFYKRAEDYSMDKNRHYYFMALKSDQIIDATVKGNISRFINHSCDPNAETQKWTVNGELRIGFFNTKFISAGEEITFDYHFQRYGKEAQKCFCEAENCRGWIGDNPDEQQEELEPESEEEEEVEEKEENVEQKERKKRVRRKREEKKDPDHMEDEDLEEEIDKICASGLKNRNHTLTLSRLMVRCREMQHRTRLLNILQSGEQPCRRLFLDYHGLRLIWSYMMDVAGDESVVAQRFRLKILKSLSTLPIPNKTMLIDSKVINVVEKWSKEFYQSPVDSPEDEQNSKPKLKEEEKLETSNDINMSDKSNDKEIKSESENNIEKAETKEENFDASVIPEIANNLLTEWANLKEVFRIPKKERLEQMKEHEREADRGYKENIKDIKEYYERYRYSSDKRSDRRRPRDVSPDYDHRSKDKRGLDDRPDLVQVPRMSKFERRQLFALKVAKEEEERQRRQQQEAWKVYESECLALGLDPYTTTAYDTQTGLPLIFNQSLGHWQVLTEGGIPQQCTPSVYVGAPGSQPVVAPNQSLPSVLPSSLTPDISPGLSSRLHTQTLYQTTPPFSSLVPQSLHSTFVTDHHVLAVHNTNSPLNIPSQSNYIEKPIETPDPTPSPQVDLLPVIELPPKWKWAKDARGRTYYYHVKERVSQWLPPPPDHIGVLPDSSSSSESSDESSSSNDEEEEDDNLLENSYNENTDIEMPLVEALANTKQVIMKKLDDVNGVILPPEPKKRRDGLVQERIISPRREEDRIDHKKFKEIKEKLRRQKEKAKYKEQLEKLKRHRSSKKTRSQIKQSIRESVQTVTSGGDMSPSQERKIKDTFRINMANVMVHFLNPYRKNDCRQGRITNTEDFKHLARKLTHFVLAKELKHCKSVDELECNDNVKHKAKDFVRKYMSKFGSVYQKDTDE